MKRLEASGLRLPIGERGASQKEEFPFLFPHQILRREKDSNLRYPFGYSGFQDHPIKPLWHPAYFSRAPSVIQKIFLSPKFFPLPPIFKIFFLLENQIRVPIIFINLGKSSSFLNKACFQEN